MKISVGIVGLPNVGKSTLFNALLKKQIAEVANYPFCTIEPNVGVVEVPDERLPVLAKIVNTDRIVPAVVEFYDIAGLVKGASQGAGLGNKFLSHIREVAAIVEVVRLFEDPNIIHVDKATDPLSDIKTIATELILADLETLEKQKEPKSNASKEDRLRWQLIELLKKKLNAGIFARQAISKTQDELTPKESELLIKHLNLLTMKPIIYLFNVSDSQLNQPETTKKQIESILHQAPNTISAKYLYLNAKLEQEMASFTPEEQKEYLKQYGLDDTGLNRLIKTAYHTLNLISFLTAGQLEVRAWTIGQGTPAQKAAGVIHSDFEKMFIKAEVIPYEEFVRLGGWQKAREQGKIQIVGKDYEIHDGDVVEFRIND